MHLTLQESTVEKLQLERRRRLSFDTWYFLQTVGIGAAWLAFVVLDLVATAYLFYWIAH